jgi:glycine cleavage system aminomethyltransferase T
MYMKELWNGPRMDWEPQYNDVYTHGNIMGKNITWSGDGWEAIGKSYFESSYIHAGISGPQTTYSGPDAEKLLSYCSINDVTKWKVNRCKHLVNLTPDGLIANHALFMKDDAQTFRTTAGCTVPIDMELGTGKYNVERKDVNVFVFQFSGPKALTILETALQENFHDLKFLEFRPCRIPEIDTQLEICRIGMSGTIAYELHGDAEFGPQVYDYVYQTGKPMGMKRMGWRDYTINHTFGGFPQMTVHFELSLYQSPEFCAMAPFMPVLSGSVEPENWRARFRTPVEVDWEWMAKFDHDFVGREALEAEVKNPKRKIVSLELNVDDMTDVYRSQFSDDPYKFMEMPCAQEQPAGGHQDYVTDQEGNVIGIASNPTYSSHYRTTICHAIIDCDRIEEGKEVILKWGDYGKKIKDIRAVITRYPFMNDVGSNQKYDVDSIPAGY